LLSTKNKEVSFLNHSIFKQKNIKNMKINKVFLLIILFLFTIQITHAQLMGGSENGSSPAQEVKAGSITSGGVSGDVNLFSGTYNTSQTLGSVSTPSGLSYTANLSYNSSFAAGDNLAQSSGIPYGEGWSLDIPTISISTEDYNRYTYTDLPKMGQINGLYSCYNGANASASFNEDASDCSNATGAPATPFFYDPIENDCDRALEEGRLYWFAPMLNLPGVASGRLVFKEKEGDEYVFVLHKFERYIEARLIKDNVNAWEHWKIIVDDGTQYELRAQTVSHRQASNQRVQTACNTNQTNNNNKDVLANLVLPKTEILTWYCNTITHPNKEGAISFTYKKLGEFDYFKLLSQYEDDSYINSEISKYFYSSSSSKKRRDVTFKEILLEEINSGYEKLTLNYNNILENGFQPQLLNDGYKLIAPTSNNQKDGGLYSFETVESWGNIQFNGWNRYLHTKGTLSDGQIGADPNSASWGSTSPTNPYIYTKDQGTSPKRVLSRESATSTTGGLNFTHDNQSYGTGTQRTFRTGYLESPRINGTEFIPGDTYELKANVINGGGSLYDINLATGDNSTFPSSGLFPNADCYSKAMGQSVFTTFNQGIKWQGGNISNFFVMPNHPLEFNGFHIQVGPSNSDINYNYLYNFGQPTNTPGVLQNPFSCSSYFNNGGAFPTGGNYGNMCSEGGLNSNIILRSGHSIPNNFGIGSPWWGLEDFYNDETSIQHCNSPFWWNKDPSLYQWNNQPTAVSENAKLDNVELIRYTKNPYMLTSVVSQSLNKNGAWATTSNIAFEYGVHRVKRFVNSISNDPCDEDNIQSAATNSYRNIFVLEAIQQLPVGNTQFGSDASAPTTRFTYTTGDLLDPLAVFNESIHNTNFVYLTNIVDALGKETTIKYYPLEHNLSSSAGNIPSNKSYSVESLILKTRPKTDKQSPSMSGDCDQNYTPILPAHPYAYQVYMVVESKRVEDKNQTLEWKYTFSSPHRYSASPAMSLHFATDASPSYKYGFGNCRVLGPMKAGTTAGPMAIYDHHTDILKWGKLYNIVSTDINNVTISSTEIGYSDVLAFDKLWDDHDDDGTNDLFFPNFEATDRMYDVPYFYETKYVTEIEAKYSDYFKSFFIKKDYEITKKHDKNGQYISSQTHYDYYDNVSSVGYSVLGVNQWGTNEDKKISFLPYKTKTYSAEHGGVSGAYTQKEYFYLFDLPKLSQYNSSTPFFNTLLDNGMRNIPFEVRTTQKGIDDNPITQSTYSIYTLDGGKIRLKEIARQAEDGLGALVSFDAAMTPSFPFETLTTSITHSWNQHNQPTLIENAKGLKTYYNYYNSIGFLRYQIVGYDSPKTFLTLYGYYSDNKLWFIQAPNAVRTYYKYDGYKRVNKIQRGTKIIQSFDYSNYADEEGGSFLSRAKNNFVNISNFTDSGSGWSEIAYVDPLGRNLANEKEGTIFGYSLYDTWGRAPLVLKPEAASSFTALESNMGSPANHAEFTFESAPRSNAVKSSKYGESISGNHIVTSEYSIISGGTLNSLLSPTNPAFFPSGGKFHRTETTDEDGKTSISITNAVGQIVATITNNGTYSTVFKYDSHGNAKKVGNPKQQISEYLYNYFGQIYKKITVDAAPVFYGYSPIGELIVENDGTSRVYEYDLYGRMISQSKASSVSSLTSNEGMAWVGNAQFDSQYEAIINSASSSGREKEWFYDNYDQSRWGEYFANTQYYLTNSLSGKHGQLIQTVSYDLNNEVSEYRFFSYNNDGFVKWEMMHYKGVSVDDPKGLLVRIDYPEYNYQGSVLKQNVDINGDHTLDFQYQYDYDGQNRLKEVYANYDDPNGSYGYKIASYIYDDIKGVVSSMDYYGGGADGCNSVDHFDYTYDIRRRLTDIQSTLFTQNLVYDGKAALSGHTIGYTNNYNGNINATQASYTFTTPGITITNAPQNIFDGATIYNYTYDDLNRLTDAAARVEMVSGIYVPTLGNVGYSFDAIGNITSLQRKALNPINQVILQDYTYNYSTSNNKLNSINETGASTLLRSFGYDGKGNLLSDSKRGIATTIYGRSNLPWTINMNHHPDDPSSNGYQVSYLYGVNDNRIFKEADGKSELYIRTTSGQEIGIYDITADQLTWYVHGNQRIASIINQVPLEFSDEKADEGIEPCPPIRGDIPLPPRDKCCQDLLLSDKEEDLRNLRTSMATKDAVMVTYPSQLHRIRGCEGLELNTFQEELDANPIEHEILATVNINNANQKFNLELSSGTTMYQVGLEEMLQTRVMDERVKIDGYIDTPTNYTPTDPFNCDLEETPNPPTPDAGYYVYDHLGNTRVHYKIDCTSGNLQYTLNHVVDYFPYGKILREFQPNNAEKFLTTQHERDVETGLDYRGARFYDSDIGRFLSLDPLAADFASWSAYNYVLGNPISYVDPDGKKPDDPPGREITLTDNKDHSILTETATTSVRKYNEGLVKSKDQRVTTINHTVTTVKLSPAGEILSKSSTSFSTKYKGWGKNKEKVKSEVIGSKQGDEVELSNESENLIETVKYYFEKADGEAGENTHVNYVKSGKKRADRVGTRATLIGGGAAIAFELSRKAKCIPCAVISGGVSTIATGVGVAATYAKYQKTETYYYIKNSRINDLTKLRW